MAVTTLADRLRAIEESPTLALAAKAKALAKSGKSVADFTAGEPDFPTPDPIKQAAIAALAANQTYYTAVAGLPELREAIAARVNAAHGTRYQAAHAIVTCGAKHALYTALQVLCQSGDEVIVFGPYWVSYPPMVRLAGATPVIVDTREADRFLPDPEELRRALTDATKVVILNSPGNPTGAVIDADRLRAIARIVRERGLLLISDEIYENLVYPPAKHLSMLDVDPQLAEQTLLVSGVSKTYSMTGWRIGYAVGPQAWIEAMGKVQGHSTSNPTTISQHAARAALTGDQRVVETMRRQFQERRDLFVRGLNALPGCRCLVPDGAFYLWCNVQGFGRPSAETANAWLDEALVATIPGEGFGASGYVRLSFATSRETIEEGLRRLSAWTKHTKSVH